MVFYLQQQKSHYFSIYTQEESDVISWIGYGGRCLATKTKYLNVLQAGVIRVACPGQLGSSFILTTTVRIPWNTSIGV